MLMGEVVGTVVSTQKDVKLKELKFQVVEQIDHLGERTGAYVVAVDAVGAGHGDRVLYATGSSARQTVLTDGKPAVCRDHGHHRLLGCPRSARLPEVILQEGSACFSARSSAAWSSTVKYPGTRGGEAARGAAHGRTRKSRGRDPRGLRCGPGRPRRLGVSRGRTRGRARSRNHLRSRGRHDSGPCGAARIAPIAERLLRGALRGRDHDGSVP